VSSDPRHQVFTWLLVLRRFSCCELTGMCLSLQREKTFQFCFPHFNCQSTSSPRGADSHRGTEAEEERAAFRRF
jgi:hypothetical protein